MKCSGKHCKASFSDNSVTEVVFNIEPGLFPWVTVILYSSQMAKLKVNWTWTWKEETLLSAAALIFHAETVMWLHWARSVAPLARPRHKWSQSELFKRKRKRVDARLSVSEALQLLFQCFRTKEEEEEEWQSETWTDLGLFLHQKLPSVTIRFKLPKNKPDLHRDLFLWDLTIKISQWANLDMLWIKTENNAPAFRV